MDPNELLAQIGLVEGELSALNVSDFGPEADGPEGWRRRTAAFNLEVIEHCLANLRDVVAHIPATQPSEE